MSLFRKKNSKILAAQWNGKNVDDIAKLNLKGSRWNRLEQSGDKLVIYFNDFAGESTLTLSKGNWVVTSPDSNASGILGYSNECFREEFDRD